MAEEATSLSIPREAKSAKILSIGTSSSRNFLASFINSGFAPLLEATSADARFLSIATALAASTFSLGNYEPDLVYLVFLCR
jgi:membrane-bound metal-dependent hydrolase YbcI (DUF457 family)